MNVTRIMWHVLSYGFRGVSGRVGCLGEWIGPLVRLGPSFTFMFFVGFDFKDLLHWRYFA